MQAELRNESFDECLQAAGGSDERAFERLVAPLLPRLDGYLRAQARDEAADLRAEVLLATYRHLSRFSGGEEQFRSWVFTIAHHRLVDHQRQIARAESLDEVPESHWAAPGPWTEFGALARGREEQLRATLDPLPAAQRQVLLLRTVGNLSLEQTAEVIGRSVGTVKLLQHRAVAALRSRFADEVA